METNVNERIEDFITEVFAPEFVSLIKRSFSLFEAFEHQNAYNGLNDVTMDESVSDIASRADRFTVELANQLDFIVKQHLIYLTDESNIKDRIEILDALYRFQHLENYDAITSILDSTDDPIDKMSRILEELTEFDQGYFLTLLKDVDPRTLKLMEMFISIMNENVVQIPPDPKIVDRVKVFVQALGQEHIGYIVLEAGMIVGLPLKLYLPFVQEHLIVENNRVQTALNILSIIYLSDVQEQAVIETYREVAEDLFKTLDEVGRVEGEMIKLMAKIDETRKINDEKARLPKESTTEQSGQ